jgi:large subunit ribosomal protein L15
MKLNEIRDNPGANRPRKRVGRGIGSGTGKTSARGHKGQKSRAGGGVRPGFEGGQMPLYRRLPKRGFKNPFRKAFVEVNLFRLQKAIDAGRIDAAQPVDEAALQAAGLFRRRKDGVRLLGKGELTAKVRLRVTGATKAAISMVERAGGTVELLTDAGAGRAAKAGDPGKGPDGGDGAAEAPKGGPDGPASGAAGGPSA